MNDWNTDLRIQVSQSLDTFGYNLMVARPQPAPGEFTVAEPVVFKTYKHGDYIRDPLLNLNQNEAQTLMNELWRNGIRPSSGEGNVGQIGAIEKHLHDMRKIVQKNLNVSFERVKP